MEQYVKLSSFIGQIKTTFIARDPYRTGRVSFSVEEFIELYSQI